MRQRPATCPLPLSSLVVFLMASASFILGEAGRPRLLFVRSFILESPWRNLRELHAERTKGPLRVGPAQDPLKGSAITHIVSGAPSAKADGGRCGDLDACDTHARDDNPTTRGGEAGGPGGPDALFVEVYVAGAVA